MKVKVESGAYTLIRAHKTDAGLDIMSRTSQVVPSHGSATFHTGIHVELPSGTAGLLVSKSGLNTRKNITSTGLIDEGYTGEIVVKLYNHGDEDYWVQSGDKISQLVVIPVIYEEIEIVGDLERKTERGDNGFGSTGR